MTVALAATALTPASGVMGAVLGVVAAGRRGLVRVVLLAAVLNGPWIVAGLRHVSIARSDPAAVGLFDVQDEGFFGRFGSALTLGGIWNLDVVPTSRTLLISVVLALVMAAVMVLGLVTLWRDDDRRLLAVLGVAGVIGLAVALSGWLAPDQMARVVAEVPAGGLIRDGTRWLALLVPLEAVAFGAGVHAAFTRFELTSWQAPVTVLALILPLAALPDLAWGVGGRLEPVSYPASWADTRRIITKTSTTGDMLVLPFTAYRAPAWNNGTPVLDPAGRYFDRTTVTNDDLEVSGQQIAGEDPRAAAVQKILRSTVVNSGDRLEALRREGIGLVVVETDTAGAPQALEQVKGAPELTVGGEGMRLFAIEGARSEPITREDRRVMTLVWAVTGIALMIGLASLMRSGVRRLHRKPAEHGPRQMPKP
ncbi:MAG: hypothetical protein H7290_00980 [Flavobacterium sp.]|nr:hypothetical protein [Aeromicrobium sp.]